ncbi:MAG: cell division ATP-binding protein FtsE [Lachnospiraceae bacterium]|nr:cell division ATP-binding protein FtsE [Candidatus Darwinimomas equi]
MIEINDVSKTYENGTRALQHVDLVIDDGEFVFFMGKSGSGKSTLLRLLLKEIDASDGDIVVNDYTLSDMPRSYVPKYRRRLGVVFQDFRLLPDRTVYENVAFAQRVIGKSTREIKESVPEVLRRVGLSSKYKSFPNQLSGGEKQRVAIARAIINKPDILLCDEPTGNLDETTAKEIMKLLDEINSQGTTVIVITHSREIVNSMDKRVITLEKGVVRSDVQHRTGI